MDPITGISLAASILQLLEAGVGATKHCREIYQQGFTNEHANANETAGKLARLSNSIQQSLQNAEMQSAKLSREEQDLMDLGRKCEECANILQHELHKLRAQPQTSPLQAVRITARSVFKKHRIVKIQEQLESHQRVLGTLLAYRSR